MVKHKTAQGTSPHVLEVSYDDIQKAMEDVKRDRFDYYLDTETGRTLQLPANIIENTLALLYDEQDEQDIDEEVLYDSSLNTSSELPEEIFDTLEKAISIIPEAKRYLRIPERDRKEAFLCMKSFAETRASGVLRTALLQSLSGAGAFRKFKDTLRQNPKARKEWNTYNAGKMRGIIKGWLDGHGIKSVRKRGSYPKNGKNKRAH